MEGLNQSGDGWFKGEGSVALFHPTAPVNLGCFEHLATREPNNGQDGRDGGDGKPHFVNGRKVVFLGCNHQVAKQEVNHVAWEFPVHPHLAKSPGLEQDGVKRENEWRQEEKPQAMTNVQQRARCSDDFSVGVVANMSEKRCQQNGVNQEVVNKPKMAVRHGVGPGKDAEKKRC